MRRPNQDPNVFAWLLAFVSLLLPWIAAIVGLAGIWRITKGEAGGYWFLAAAAAMLIADALVDFAWSRPGVLPTDQPDLNQRPAQLIGRVGVVEEAIVNGRGKVRIGDTVWVVEGPDTPSDSDVRVTAARGAILRVERT